MSPDLQYSVLIAKEWAVGNSSILDAAIDYSFTDSTTGGTQPSDATEDYGVANARIGYGSNDGKWRVLLWGRNITDEYYYPAAYQGGNGPFIRVNGMPRTWGITLDYKFGSY
jgi:iron complex outermembrane receptor protein